MARPKPLNKRSTLAPALALPGRCAPPLWAWLAVGALGSVRGHLVAQEALRYSIAGEATAMSKIVEVENQPFTFKFGDFRALLTPSFEADWNDNVYLSKNNPQDDFILTPLLRMDASYPLTDRNLLRINLGVGYNAYITHNDLSRLLLQSGSQISFDLYVKDFSINLHDQFSYVQDSATQAAVANTGNYGNFQNIVGAGVTWDLEDVTVPFGYDHLNYLATSSSWNYTDHSSEMFNLRPGLRVHPQLTLGAEGTITYTTYDQPVLNDNTAYTLGVYATYKPGLYFNLQPRFGYTIYDFRQTSHTIPAQNQDTWYADITLSHQATKTITYSLSAGHELKLGVESDLIEDWYVRPNLIWAAFKDVNLTLSLFYENGNEKGGALPTYGETHYTWYGGSLGAGYTVNNNLNVSLTYRLTLRSSDLSSQEYTQNVVGILIAYALK
jgi:hypothetical protein